MSSNPDKCLLMADTDTTDLEAALVGAFDSDDRPPVRCVAEVSNLLHGSTVKKLRRYLSYFLLPLREVLSHPEENVIIGWQQFHALNFAMFCRLLKVKRKYKVVPFNYTYKKKGGAIGKLYRSYMKYAVTSDHIAGLHVLSETYAREISEEFNVPLDKFIVTGFGTPDISGQWSQLPAPGIDNYALSIGRSNRDFDALVEIWSDPAIKATGMKLVIIADTWTPKADLTAHPEIIHLNNLTGKASYPYIANCSLSIVTIKNPVMCSGDTVLLNSMMMSKPVVITNPSTLSEMYVTDGVDGLYIPTDPKKAASIILPLIKDAELRERLGTNGRQTYLSRFTREALFRNAVRQMQQKGIIGGVGGLCEKA